ncbi:hypothetical protein PIROE2DRAFT_16697 [Piromyces sp. E2]|nr:hypothetical protein PIROE2DRAFT_16697 [Piromyces sp. E2]|eukprot:OUM58116.1 hypothetical protein PIROE2DRAFT_16697 [Piromyces sp. E2]
MFLYFLSFNFNIYSNYKNCAINFVLKHSGILLIYIIFLIYLYTGYQLGFNIKELDRLNLTIFQSSKIEESPKSVNELSSKKSNSNSTLKESVILNLEQELNNMNIDNIMNQELVNGVTKFFVQPKKNNEINILNKLNKSISFVHSLYTEIFLLYIVLNGVFTFIVIYYSKKEDSYGQEFNGKWRYKCPIYNFDVVMDIIEILLVFYLLVISLTVYNYIYIFKCIKYIGYSTIVWVILGPLANV